MYNFLDFPQPFDFCRRAVIFLKFSNGHIFKFKFQISTVKNIFKRFSTRFYLRHDGAHINHKNHYFTTQHKVFFFTISSVLVLFLFDPPVVRAYQIETDFMITFTLYMYRSNYQVFGMSRDGVTKQKTMTQIQTTSRCE